VLPPATIGASGSYEGTMVPGRRRVFDSLMVRASAGGATRRSGDRGHSRRRIVRRVLLATAVLLTIVAPGVGRAASESEAWLSARQVWMTGSTAIGDAAKVLGDGGSPDEMRDLRRAVADAIQELDALEVHDCFRVWWSYVRTSYLLFDQALAGMERGDLGLVQIATASSRFLAAQAKLTVVDCPGTGVAPTGRGDARRGVDRWLAIPLTA
jgi:hypothetical protein